MELIDIKDLYACPEKYIGQEITVGGWVRFPSPAVFLCPLFLAVY